MEFSVFAQTLEELEGTEKRLEMTDALAELFRKADKDNINRLVYLLQGNVAPPYEGLEVGMGEKFVEEAISKSTGYSRTEVEKKYKEQGDLGLVAEEFLKSKKQTTLASETLTVEKVFDTFLKIAKLSGRGSQDQKILFLTELLNNAKSREGRYVVRFPLGRLRLGVGDPTILDALSVMRARDKSLRENLERAYNLCSDLGQVAKAFFEHGDVSKFEITLFKPIRPALAERLKSAEEIIEKIGKCAIEAKYDGFRCISGLTPIYVKERGIVSVRDVKVGDSVLTHNGRFRKVVAKKKRVIEPEERVFRFQSYLGNEFKITEGHRVRICRNAKERWVPIEEVSKEDELVFPMPQYGASRNRIPEEVELKTKSGYKKTVRLDKKFFRFMGYWIGDGYTNNYHSTERVGLIFNQRKGRDLCNLYKKIVSESFGIDSISENTHNGAIYLYWRDKPFREWLSENFRREWKGKMLPEWFWDITKENFDSFLKGWIESDGHTDKLGRTSITTKEADLAAFFQLLALKFKKIIGLRRVRVKDRTYYKLVITKNGRKARADGNRIYVKILRNDELRRRHPREVDPRQIVWNLQVEGDESYCTTMATLHNCQIHKDGDRVEIFSRRLEKMTHMFPELVVAVRKHLKGKKAIVEGEALSYNSKTGKFYPFQVTIQRKRKYGVGKMAEEYPLKLFLFDIMYMDGKDLTLMRYEDRREELKKAVEPNEVIEVSEGIVTGDPKEIENYFDKYVSRGLEGIIAKDLNAPYVAGKRKFAWIKLKRSYKGELADTVDVTIVGYFKGRGARAKFGLGGLLGAVYEPETNTFKTITRIGTGFSDEQLRSFREKLDKISEPHRHARVDSLVKADVWVEPKYVITLTADEITKSPMHTCGMKEGAGYALRFPRLVGDIREDKNPEDSTSVEEIIEMYRMQMR